MSSKPIKTAICIIGKDKESRINRLLDSTQGVFDLYVYQDTGSIDNSIQTFEKWCKEHDKECVTSKKFIGKDYPFVTVNGIKVLGDFAKARNDSFDMARGKCDYAFWMDTDDVLVNPQVIPQVTKFMKDNQVHLALMTYVYAKGDGKIRPVVQKRERIIDITVPGKWFDRVHETYSIEGEPKIMDVKDGWVEHERSNLEAMDTGRRNNLIMTAQLKAEGIDVFSDKMLHNLAFDHWEHHEYKESIGYYDIFLQRKTIVAEQRFEVLLKLARAYLGLGNVEQAIVMANRAITINSKMPEPYLLLSECYATIGNWDDVTHFADKVLAIGKPDTAQPVNEAEYTVIPLRLKIQACLQTNKLQDALELSKKLYEISGSPEVVGEIRGIEDEIKRTMVITGLYNLIRYYQDNNLHAELDRVKEAIPFDLLDHPTIRGLLKEISSDYKRKSSHIEYKGNKIIVFYAGQQAIEDWNGESDIKKGIGGSEGMCIQLSRELAKLGNKVFVFNSCGESSGKVFDGVTYLDWRKWNSDMKCDVFVSLRRPDVFQKVIKAKKQYLWLHDTDYGDVPKSIMYAPNKIIVLSQAHKEVIKQAHGITKDNIFWISRNGYNPLAVEYADEKAGKRNPYQIVYASSYDRGLDFVLESWGRIKSEIPEAVLKIYYGWNTYDALMVHRNPEWQKQMKEYKSNIVQMIANSKDVYELGRVSQNELYKSFKESSVWYYPSTFYEISCITAMQAQVTGCVPITTPYAALNETNKYGFKYNREHIVDGLIYWLKNVKELDKIRDNMMMRSRKDFSMAELAKNWDKFFNED